MTIGIDIRTLLDRHYSGVSAYTFNLINHLLLADQKNRYRLYYNCGRDLSDRLPRFPSEKTEIVSTRYSNKLFNYLLQKVFHYPKIDSLLKLNARTDVFLAPHINFLALSKRNKKVLTIHDLSFLRRGEFFSRRQNFWHRMINVKKLARQFDALVAVSRHTKNDIVELLNYPAEKVRVIYSGIGREYRPIDNSLELARVKEKYHLPKDFVLYLGNIEPRKNLVGLIKSYELLRQDSRFDRLKLVLAGATGWRVKEIFLARRASKYKDDIIFLGYVDDGDKPALYSSAKVFAYPSFYEGFGFPPLEAMACGTPVVASSASSLPEVLGAAAVLVDPDNPAALFAAIKEVLTDEKLRMELRRLGIERAKMFSWEKTAQEYLKLFSELTK